MIEVKDLHKSFGTKHAVRGISFQLEKGQVLGFLGPNGAGKSTTMRMITGFFPPTSGSIFICGKNLLEDEIGAKSTLGYLPENAPLYTDMTVESFLHFCAQIRGLSGRDKHNAVERALETCFLHSVRYQSIDTLSKGYRHRTCLAQSILHDPEVLILDEPTDGLDPNQKQVVRELIKNMGKEKAIIFSTHILEEVEASCTRAVIINQGQIVADGTPDELKTKAPGAGRLKLNLAQEPSSEFKKSLEALAADQKLNEIVHSSGDKGVYSYEINPDPKKAQQFVNQVHELIQTYKIHPLELKFVEGRLDDLFHKITKTEG